MKRVLLLLAGALAASAQTQPIHLTLAQAEQIALRQNPSVAALQFNAQAAAQVPAQYKSALYPNLSANFTGAGAPNDSRIAAGGLNNPSIFSRMASGFTVSQLLFDFGRTNHLTESATYHARAEQENANTGRASVLLDVNRAYFGALRARAILRVAEQTVAARQVLVDQVKALADAKLKSGLDLSFVRVNLSEAQLLLESARNERQAADANLAAALGMPATTTFDLAEEPSTAPEKRTIEQLTQEALQHRPEVASRRMELASSEETAAAERKLKFPTLAAVASAGVVPFRVDGLHNSDYIAGGININLPFLNGGLYKARENEAALQARAAESRVKDIEIQIERSVRVAFLNLNTAVQRVQLTEQLVAHASQALELAQARYDLGLSSIVELSQAELAQTEAEIQRASARYDYETQRSTLSYEVGELR
jgi:outer membrane protein